MARLGPRQSETIVQSGHETARKLLFVHGVRFAALLGIGGGISAFIGVIIVDFYFMGAEIALQTALVGALFCRAFVLASIRGWL